MANRGHESGVALIAVLWLLILMSLISAALVALCRSETIVSANASARARAVAIADAGISLAVLALTDERALSDWPVDGTPHEAVFDGSPITIAVRAEAGKIDLNTGADEELQALFTSLGVSEEQAQALVDAVGDWRDEDDFRRPNGAERAEYAAAGRLGPKNARFERVDELRDVLGITLELYSSVRSSLTVYSSRASVDLRSASSALLSALHRQNDSSDSDSVASEPGAMMHPAGAVGEPGAALNQVYCIRSTSRLPEGYVATGEAIVRITGIRRQPYWIHETGSELGCVRE